MSDALWWVPSLVVFGAAALIAAGAVVGVRRLGAGREQRALAGVRRDEVDAKVLIVRADEAVREAEREAAFVEAGFGAEAADRFRAEVERARGPLREAMLLQQRLDDAIPDTAAQRRDWSRRIAELCAAALEIVERADASAAAARAAERDAVGRLPQLRERAAALEARHAEALTQFDAVATRYAESALASSRDAAARAAAALAEALRIDAGAASTTGALDAAAVSRLEAVLARAERELADAESAERRLDDAAAALTDDEQRLAAALAAARTEADAAARDLADPRLSAAAEELGAAIAACSAALAQAPTGLPDPVARQARLRALHDRLDTALAEVRRAGGRLDGARSALAGALSIAEHTLREASAVIDRGRGRVGADARTRLADAERELVVARQEPDPVAALDAARRAAARAADADALARYDLSR
ncbi:hypothetical protein FLP10_12325 [Agromyces intestinalis]|uniref:TPM domain-containing protein n=1 Tax=Agromyces intestinalis TaxID=2592652 RepID=A0A5C1YJ08_9MICO|nr:hypothetical protein [Agromyces intestinalis]QEO15109.1 hypothetical protein FLP10_12325 [Agromyces intestinalis]